MPQLELSTMESVAVLPDLADYDYVVVNTSAGKDSQCMMDVIAELATAQSFPASRVVAVHADLGRVEWKGTKELAERQTARYGFRFEVVKRPQGDLLEHVKARGMWPSSSARYCTSDHKRGQVYTLFTRLAKEHGAKAGRPVRILNCLGMRAQESPARAKLAEFGRDTMASNGRRIVDKWLPIHHWTTDQVWKRIRTSGVEHHRAYDLGMPRLSCAFCIFSPKAALMVAGKHNPQLLDVYVQTESEIGHDFRKGFKLAEIKEALARGESAGPVDDWTM